MPTNKPEVVLPEDLRLLIVCDTQFGWNGQTTLKVEELERLAARGWLKEGIDYYEVTEAGRKLINDTLTRPADGDFVMVPRSEMERVIHELRTYSPIADACKGVHIHSVWARELERLSAAPQQPVEDGLARIAGMTFLLHENPDADEDVPPTQLVMAMSVGDTVYCHRITHGNNGICRDDAPHQHGQEVVAGVKLLNDVERNSLNDLLSNLEHEAGDVEDLPPSIEDDDAYWPYHQWHAITKLLRRENAPVSATQPQQPAEAAAGEDETIYTLSGLIIYGKIAGNARQGAVPHYLRSLVRQMVPYLEVLQANNVATPPPAIDIGKLRELAERIATNCESEAEWHKDMNAKYDWDTEHAAWESRNRIDAVDLRDFLALIGDGGEKGNG